MKKIQSLHSHTLLSDGKLDHLQSLKIAEKLGIEYLAFTEHDVLPTESQIEALRGIATGVKWIIGIELAAGLPKELGGGSNGPHMIGLFIDVENKALIEHCKKSLEQRIKRMGKMVKNLKDLGFDLKLSEVLEVAKGTSVGSPHLVEALLSKSSNLRLINGYQEKMRLKAMHDEKLQKKYQNMVQQGSRQLVYGLFLNEDAFMAKEVRAPYEYWLDFDQSVKLIREAGGVSSFAHFAMHRFSFPLDMVEKLLKEGRVDGAETVYGFWTKGKNDEEQTKMERNKIREWVKKYEKVATGGADAHSEQNFRDFAEDVEYSKETIGMVEAILDKKQVSLKWTNFES